MENEIYKSQLSTNSLIQLKLKLPKGAYSIIAKHFKVNKSTVSRVLDGKVENLELIEFAISLVENQCNKIGALSERIDNL